MSPKNPSKETTSQETSKHSRNPKGEKSIFTRDLTPSELQSLRNDIKQASELGKRYFKNKYKSP